MKIILTIVLSVALSASFAEENANFGVGSLGYATNCARSVSVGTRAGYMSSNVFDSVIVGDHALYKSAFVDGVVAIGANEFGGAKLLQNTTSINGHQLWVSEPLDAFCISTERGGAITNAPLYLWRGTLHLNATNIVGKNGGPIGGGNHVSLTNATESLAEWKVLTVDNTSAVLVDNYADSTTPHKRNWASNSYQAERIYNYSSADDAHAEFENGLFYITEAGTNKGHALTTANSLRMSAEGLTVTVYGSDGNAIGTFQLTPAQ